MDNDKDTTVVDDLDVTNIEPVNPEIADTETTDTQPDLTDMPDSSGVVEEDKGGIVRNIMKKLGIGKTDAPAGEGDEGDPVPDEFVEAAKGQGWTDEDIVNFAENMSDEELIAAIPDMLDTSVDAEPDKGPAKHDQIEKPPQEPDKPTDKPDDLEAIKAAIRDEIRAEFKIELDDLKSKLSQVDEINEQKSQAALLDVINTTFDEAAEKFEIFGKTEELPRYPAGPKKGQYVPTSPAFQAREEVYQKAQAFMALGAKPKEAMEDALTWYKGKHLERDIHRNVIKDLKKHETKLSAKRSAKETVKTYEDEDDRRADVVRELARKAGVKGSFDED